MLFRANFKKKKKKKKSKDCFIVEKYIFVKRQNFISTFKICFETWKFFHKILNKICLKVGKPKLKSHNFKSCMFDDPVIVNTAFP